MLDRLTRLQLTIFAVVTVLTVGAISIFYLHVPAAVGIGSYKVEANFVAGGGLYQNANVTYRGVTVGRVESVGLTNDGVVAQHAAQQRHSGARQRHRDGQERLRRRRAVHRPGAAGGRRRARRCATGRPSTRTHTRDRAGHLRAADRGRQAGQQRRQQPAAGSAARNVQGVQRFRTGVGAADPVVAAAWSTRRTPTTGRSPS